MSYTYTPAKDRLEIYRRNLGNIKINSVQICVPTYEDLKRLKTTREIPEPQRGLIGIIKGILKLDDLQELVSINGHEYPVTRIQNSNNIIFNCERKTGFFKREKFQAPFADSYLSTQSAEEITLAASIEDFE